MLPNLDKTDWDRATGRLGNLRRPVPTILDLVHPTTSLPRRLVSLVGFSQYYPRCIVHCTLHSKRSYLALGRAECWRWPSLFTMTSAPSSNTCGVCAGYLSLTYRPFQLTRSVSGDLDMMPGSLAEFALEHEFDDHHYLKNSWMRDIVTSIVRVSLPSHSPLRR